MSNVTYSVEKSIKHNAPFIQESDLDIAQNIDEMHGTVRFVFHPSAEELQAFLEQIEPLKQKSFLEKIIFYHGENKKTCMEFPMVYVYPNGIEIESRIEDVTCSLNTTVKRQKKPQYTQRQEEVQISSIPLSS